MSQWPYFSRFFIGPSFGSTQENTVKCIRHFLKSVPVVHRWGENSLGVFFLRMFYVIWVLGAGDWSGIFLRDFWEKEKIFRNLLNCSLKFHERKFFVLWLTGVKGSEGLCFRKLFFTQRCITSKYFNNVEDILKKK